MTLCEYVRLFVIIRTLATHHDEWKAQYTKYCHCLRVIALAYLVRITLFIAFIVFLLYAQLSILVASRELVQEQLQITDDRADQPFHDFNTRVSPWYKVA